jgi:hypothetical protein
MAANPGCTSRIGGQLQVDLGGLSRKKINPTIILKKVWMGLLWPGP